MKKFNKTQHQEKSIKFDNENSTSTDSKNYLHLLPVNYLTGPIPVLLPQDLVRKNGIHCLLDNEFDALKALSQKKFRKPNTKELAALNKLFKVVSPGIEGCLALCAKNFSVFFMGEDSRRERSELLNIEGQKVEVPGLADFSRGIAEFNLQH